MEQVVPVENRARLEADAFARLAGALARQGSIKQAIDWLAAHERRLAPTGLVTQDEFSHDVLVAYPGGLWLVYDST